MEVIRKLFRGIFFKWVVLFMVMFENVLKMILFVVVLWMKFCSVVGRLILGILCCKKFNCDGMIVSNLILY